VTLYLLYYQTPITPNSFPECSGVPAPTPLASSNLKRVKSFLFRLLRPLQATPEGIWSDTPLRTKRLRLHSGHSDPLGKWDRSRHWHDPPISVLAELLYYPDQAALGQKLPRSIVSLA
jgi:hypothetical protein